MRDPDCEAVPVRDFVGYLNRLAAFQDASADRQKQFGWRGLGFARVIGDPMNPRREKLQGPAIFAATWDFEQDTSWVEVVGGVQMFSTAWGVDRHTYRAPSGAVDFEFNSGNNSGQKPDPCVGSGYIDLDVGGGAREP